jgi:hypothetical protein
MEEMVLKHSVTIDAGKYGRLCAKSPPNVIANDEEFQRRAVEIEPLDRMELDRMDMARWRGLFGDSLGTQAARR